VRPAPKARPAPPVPPTPLGTAALAARLGVSARTLRTWVRRGLPVLTTRPLTFDPQAAAAWKDQYAGHATLGHGGRRPNAGRPAGRTSARSTADPAPRRGTDAPPRRSSHRTPPPGDRPAGTTAQRRHNNVDPDSSAAAPPQNSTHPTALTEAEMERALESGMATAAQLDLFRERLKVLKDLRADRAERGLLLRASEVESQWLDLLAGVRAALDQAPAQVSTRATAELGLRPELEVAIRRIAEEVIAAAMRSLWSSATQPPHPPPPPQPTQPPPPRPPATPPSRTSPAAASPASSPPSST